VLGLTASDLRGDAAAAKLTAVFVVVVAAVGADFFRPAARASDLAAQRRHAFDQRQELGYVVAVAARDRPGERDPGRIDEKMMFSNNGSIRTHNSSDTIHGATVTDTLPAWRPISTAFVVREWVPSFRFEFLEGAVLSR
jgi:hypothetical protein